MIQVTRTFTRPDASIPWHDENHPFAPYRDHMSNNYFKTKKIIYNESPVSEDKLSRTFMQIWADQEFHNEWLNDPHFQEFYRARDMYNESVGIVAGERIITEL
jgi:quinol monooxygenase YgiN